MYDIIKSRKYDGDDGTDIDSIVDALKDEGIDAYEVDEAVNDILAEGYIFTTIDDNHFKDIGSFGSTALSSSGGPINLGPMLGGSSLMTGVVPHQITSTTPVPMPLPPHLAKLSFELRRRDIPAWLRRLCCEAGIEVDGPSSSGLEDNSTVTAATAKHDKADVLSPQSHQQSRTSLRERALRNELECIEIALKNVLHTALRWADEAKRSRRTWIVSADGVMCPNCTLINPAHVTACEVCQTLRDDDDNLEDDKDIDEGYGIVSDLFSAAIDSEDGGSMKAQKVSSFSFSASDKWEKKKKDSSTSVWLSKKDRAEVSRLLTRKKRAKESNESRDELTRDLHATSSSTKDTVSISSETQKAKPLTIPKKWTIQVLKKKQNAVLGFKYEKWHFCSKCRRNIASSLIQQCQKAFLKNKRSSTSTNIENLTNTRVPPWYICPHCHAPNKGAPGYYWAYSLYDKAAKQKLALTASHPPSPDGGASGGTAPGDGFGAPVGFTAGFNLSSIPASPAVGTPTSSGHSSASQSGIVSTTSVAMDKVAHKVDVQGPYVKPEELTSALRDEFTELLRKLRCGEFDPSIAKMNLSSSRTDTNDTFQNNLTNTSPFGEWTGPFYQSAGGLFNGEDEVPDDAGDYDDYEGAGGPDDAGDYANYDDYEAEIDFHYQGEEQYNSDDTNDQSLEYSNNEGGGFDFSDPY